MSKKSKTTEQSTTNQTSTSTPTVAPWLNNNYEQLGGLINNFAGTDPSSYVAGASDLQNQGFEGASNLGGWQSLFDQAQSTAQGINTNANTAGAASILDNGGVTPYLNTGLNAVVDSSLANYDHTAAQKVAAQKAQAGLNKAFGGSRYALGEAQLGADLTRGRATTESGLRYDAFDKAAGLASADAGRRQEANLFNANQQDQAAALQAQLAGLFGDLGNSQAGNERSDVGTQLAAGDQQRQIEQAGLNATPTFLQLLASLNGSMPIGSFTSTTGTGQGTTSGTSTTTSSDPMKTIGQAAQVAALFSDIRLKRDITPLGIRQGRKWYQYRYLWSGDLQEGVMAHENLDIATVHPSGFLMVDYSKLGA